MHTLPILEKIRQALAGRTSGEWQWHNRVFNNNDEMKVIGYDRLESYEEGGGDDVVAWRKEAWLAVKPADAEIIANAPEWLEAMLPIVQAALNCYHAPDGWDTSVNGKLPMVEFRELMKTVTDFKKFDFQKTMEEKEAKNE